MAKIEKKTRDLRWLFAACASLVLFIIVTIPVLDRSFSQIERSIFTFFFSVPTVFIYPLEIVTHLGSTAAITGICVALWFIGRKRLSAELGFASVIAFYLSVALKAVVARPRPPVYFTDLVQREWGTTGNGFPSGHAALVTVLALCLWPHVERKYRPLLIILVIAVSVSRISLGVHAPLDIVGGIFVGVFVVSITKIIYPYVLRLKSIAQ